MRLKQIGAWTSAAKIRINVPPGADHDRSSALNERNCLLEKSQSNTFCFIRNHVSGTEGYSEFLVAVFARHCVTDPLIHRAFTSPEPWHEPQSGYRGEPSSSQQSTMVSSICSKHFNQRLIRAIADMIQQMYLKELQSYKSPPVKAGDSEGLVQKFSPPAPPKAPEDTDLAKDMKDYEDQVVEIEGQAAAGEQTETEGDYFEDLKQFDEEPAPH